MVAADFCPGYSGGKTAGDIFLGGKILVFNIGNNFGLTKFDIARKY